MLQMLHLLHVKNQRLGHAEFAYKLPTSAYKLPSQKVKSLHILHDSIYMILYIRLYIRSFSILCNFCSRVADVARQKVCLVRACARRLVRKGDETGTVAGRHSDCLTKGKSHKNSEVKNTGNVVVHFSIIYEVGNKSNLSNQPNPHH